MKKGVSNRITLSGHQHPLSSRIPNRLYYYQVSFIMDMFGDYAYNAQQGLAVDFPIQRNRDSSSIQ